MINGEYYFYQIISKMWYDNIKIITGIKKCGKSTLIFELFYEYLIKNEDEENNIISGILWEI